MAYDITFALSLFNRDLDADESLEALNILAGALQQIDMGYLRRHPQTPELYSSGVRYQEERPGQERWQDIPQVLQRGVGDCEDLSAWRAAELNIRSGISARAEVAVSKVYPDGRRLYHVFVRLPDGTIEDPSRILGMQSTSNISLVSRR